MDAFDKAIEAKIMEAVVEAFAADSPPAPRHTFPATAYHADTHTTDWRRALHDGWRD